MEWKETGTAPQGLCRRLKEFGGWGMREKTIAADLRIAMQNRRLPPARRINRLKAKNSKSEKNQDQKISAGKKSTKRIRIFSQKIIQNSFTQFG